MVWIEFESFGFFCPCFDDEFIGRQTLESFEPAGIVVCVDEEMGFELLMAIVVVALDDGDWPAPSGSLDYFVLLDGLPPSSWRSREEFVP